LFQRLVRKAVACGPLELAVPERLHGQSGTACMVLGLLFGQIADFVGVEGVPDVQARDFQSKMQVSLRVGFGRLRREAELQNDRDVYGILQDEAQCREALVSLIAVPAVDVPGEFGQARLGGCRAAGDSLGRGQGASVEQAVTSLRVLTWNVSDVVDRLSAAVPEDADWSVVDNSAAVQAQALRLKPDVVAFQECQSEAPLADLAREYRLVGTARSHCGFVHLYVVHGLETRTLEMPAEVPVVGVTVRLCDGLDVDLMAVHFPAGEHNAAARRRLLSHDLKHVLQQKRPLVLAGDFNVREDEAAKWRERFGLQDAGYAGYSWCPKTTRYRPKPEGEYHPQGCRFDRVFGCRVQAAHAYLAGKVIHFTNTGHEFHLSDHFAVVAVLGFARCVGKRDLKALNMRVANMRDAELMSEARLVREMLVVGREQAIASRARAVAQNQEAAATRARKARKDAAKKREAAARVAFGKDSLFADALDDRFVSPGPVPPAAWTVTSDLDWDAADPSDGVEGCRIGGLRREGPQSYVLAALQCVLRLPLLQAMLRRHCAVCGEGENCVSCALWRSREAFSGDRLAGLLSLRHLVSSAFGDDGEHDVAEFLVGLLRSMAAREVREQRCVSWLDAADSLMRSHFATFVERIFGFVLEKRRRCALCGCCCAPEFEVRTVLVLPVPLEDDASPVTPTELYMRFCGPVYLEGDEAVLCQKCGRLTKHEQQQRIRQAPRVLAVHFERSSGRPGRRSSRCPMDLEFEVVWPHLPSFELHGVVYHRGFDASRGHYSAAVRCLQKRFWRFDDDRLCREVVGDVCALLPTQIVLAFYEGSAAAASSGRRAGHLVRRGGAGEPGTVQGSFLIGLLLLWCSMRQFVRRFERELCGSWRGAARP
jgi:endonuclease/exonuclease/phosphatase family metal-dependent hydrolase